MSDIIETKYFTDENGVEMKKEFYANGMTITQVANPPKVQNIYIPSGMETLQSKMDYLLMKGSE